MMGDPCNPERELHPQCCPSSHTALLLLLALQGKRGFAVFLHVELRSEAGQKFPGENISPSSPRNLIAPESPPSRPVQHLHPGQ